MRRANFLEYWGEISADLIAHHLTNKNEFGPTADDVRQAFPLGLTVSVQIEQTIRETPEEQQEAGAAPMIAGRLRRWHGTETPDREIVGLVLSRKTKI